MYMRIVSTLAIVAPFVLGASALATAQPATLPATEPLPAIAVSQIALPPAPISEAQLLAIDRFRADVLGLEVQFDPLTSTPSHIYSTEAFLTDPIVEPFERAASTTVLQDFILNNEQLFRLSESDLRTLALIQDLPSASEIPPVPLLLAPIYSIVYEQRWQGRQVFPTSLIGSITGRGELVSVSTTLVPDLEAAVNRTEPLLTPMTAIGFATSDLGGNFVPSQHRPIGPPRGDERRQSFTTGDTFDQRVSVRLIYYRVSAAEVRLVWEVVLGLRNDLFRYQVLVDDTDGEILWRETITAHDAPLWLAYFDVRGKSPASARDDYLPADSPRPRSPGPETPTGGQGALVPAQSFQTNGDPVASPTGWLPRRADRTSGNNAIAFFDFDGNGEPGRNEHAAARIVTVAGQPTRAFRFPADFGKERNATANRRAAVVNGFAVVNWWHDRMDQLGFTEEAGNFQATNYQMHDDTHDDDAVRVKIREAFGRASFDTPPADGLCCPHLNIQPYDGQHRNRSAAFDNEVLIHELTHGLTQRMIGGKNRLGLSSKEKQASGLGEGYSDLFALLLLRQLDEDPDGNYTIGSYTMYRYRHATLPSEWSDNAYFGMRRFPYSTDLCVNPLTLLDMQTVTYDRSPLPTAGCTAVPPINPRLRKASGDPHSTGEVWVAVVWEARRNLVRKHGSETGNELMLVLLTTSLRSLPKNPTFVQARQALLDVDRVGRGGEDSCELWRGFAKRGMGIGAATPKRGSIREDFRVPERCIVP